MRNQCAINPINDLSIQSTQSYQSQTQTITDANDIQPYVYLVMDQLGHSILLATAMNNGHLMIGYIGICNLELNLLMHGSFIIGRK